MGKSLKLVHILDQDPKNRPSYTGALEGSGFLLSFSEKLKDFYEAIDDIIPDLIIINGGKEGFDIESIHKHLLKNILLSSTPVMLVVDKIVYSVEQKSKKLSFVPIEFPIRNSELLQYARKLVSHQEVPGVYFFEDKPLAQIEVEGDIVKVALDQITFLSPVKLRKDSVVKLESNFFNEVGIERKNFSVIENGEMRENKMYENIVILRGLCSGVFAKLKKFYSSNRKK